MKRKILLVIGDPISINSEIIFKVWKKLNHIQKKNIYLISNYELMKAQLKKLKYSLKLTKVRNLNQEAKRDFLKIIDINIKFKKPFSISKKNRSDFVKKCLNLSHRLAVKEKVAGIINCAIDKSLLGKKRIGVTEYLASKCNVRNNSEVMLIRNKNLSVVPITTHVNIKQIVRRINKIKIINKVKTIEKFFKNYFKKKPKIGILGLNPHNAEFVKESEEKKIILPAIKKLNLLKFKIKGPLVADTLFIKEYKNFDVIVGMYHDQVLAPFKAIFKFHAINVTLGLKYLRVSPDHGTAISLIGKKKAKPESLVECINFVSKFGK